MGIVSNLRRIAVVASFAAGVAMVSTAAMAAGDAKHPEKLDWQFSGIFGTVDMHSAQRGLQVYLEVCAGCHSLKHVAYRNLGALGFTEDEIKAIAANFEVTDGPDSEGEMFQRPAIQSDLFVSPFPNQEAASASNNGANPPDLSLQVKAHPGGADYIHALLTGYTDAPEGVDMPDGSNYNAFFPGGFIAMPPPLFEDGVEYSDGTAATVDQMATDVVNFLQWTASPEMEQRKKTGFKAVIFLIILSAILYAGKRKLWSNIDH